MSLDLRNKEPAMQRARGDHPNRKKSRDKGHGVDTDKDKGHGVDTDRVSLRDTNMLKGSKQS